MRSLTRSPVPHSPHNAAIKPGGCSASTMSPRCRSRATGYPVSCLTSLETGLNMSCLPDGIIASAKIMLQPNHQVRAPLTKKGGHHLILTGTRPLAPPIDASTGRHLVPSNDLAGIPDFLCQ